MTHGPITWRLWVILGAKDFKEGVSGQVEAERGIAGHSVQRSGVEEHRLGELVKPVVGGLDAEKVGNNRFDGGGLT